MNMEDDLWYIFKCFALGSTIIGVMVGLIVALAYFSLAVYALGGITLIITATVLGAMILE